MTSFSSIVAGLLSGLIPWVFLGLAIGAALGVTYAKSFLPRYEGVAHRGYVALAVVGGCAGGLLLGLAIGLNIQFGAMVDKTYAALKPAMSSALGAVGIDPDAIPSGKAMEAVDAGLKTLSQAGGDWGEGQSRAIRAKAVSIPGFAEKETSLDGIYRQVKSAAVMKLGRYLPLVYAASVILPLIFIFLIRLAMGQEARDKAERKEAEDSGQIMF